MSIDIDISELADLSQRLNLADRSIAAAAAKAVALATTVTRSEAIRRAPVQEGTLRAGITSTGGGLTRLVKSTARHAMFVEFGTSKMSPRPHVMPAGDVGEAALLSELTRIAGRGL